MTPPLIRPFRPEDESAIRRICYDTALYGRPIEPLFPDPVFIGEAWIRYYVAYEPEHLWIADVDHEVAGYLTGSADTRRSISRFKTRILPRLIGRFLLKGHWMSPLFWRLLWSYGVRRTHVSDRRAEVIEKYPAHCHMNLAEGYRCRGIGAQLLRRFLGQLQTEGVPGIHVSTATHGGQSLFAKEGFVELARIPAPPLTEESPKEILIMGKDLKIKGR